MTRDGKNAFFSVVAGMAVSALSAAAFGAVVYVSPDGKSAEEGGTGTLSAPYDIHTGVSQAGNGGEVRLLMSESSYCLTNQVSINSRTLRGWDGAADAPAGREGRDKVVLDGGGTLRCLYSGNLGGDWSIADLTLVNGCPTLDGSLLYGLNVTGHCVVSNCVFRDSSCTDSQRCVYVNVYEENTLSFVDCDFRELEALDWYGFLYSTGKPGTISFGRCRFINNVNTGSSASYGSFAYGDGDFTDCVISNNTGTGVGGFSMGRSAWTRCLFADNRNSNCGACLYNRGTMVVRDCLFTNNVCCATGVNGGGCISAGYISGNSAAGIVAVTNCVFTGNSSHSAGAVASFRSKAGTIADISFTDCLFVTNVSGACLSSSGRSLGGAVITGSNVADFHLDRCRFTDNVASGIYAAVRMTGMTNSYIRNCLFLRNRSFGSNGGSSEGAVSLIGTSYVHNCTFVANSTANNLFGALLAGGDKTAGPEKLVANCIFWENSRYNGGKTDKYASCNAASDGDVRFWNCFSQYGFLPEGQGNIGGSSKDPLDPRFVDVEADDYRLEKKSVCVDAGLDAAWMTGSKDLQALRRPRRIEGKAVDIGCYEYLWPSGFGLILR